MKRHIASIAVAALIAAVLAACSSASADRHTEQAAPATAAASEPSDVTDFLGRDDESGAMDCDADDKAKKEVPDCGFYAGPDNRTFYWWSWVKAGKATPPAGWSADREVGPHRPPGPTRRARG